MQSLPLQHGGIFPQDVESFWILLPYFLATHRESQKLPTLTAFLFTPFSTTVLQLSVRPNVLYLKSKYTSWYTIGQHTPWIPGTIWQNRKKIEGYKINLMQHLPSRRVYHKNKGDQFLIINKDAIPTSTCWNRIIRGHKGSSTECAGRFVPLIVQTLQRSMRFPDKSLTLTQKWQINSNLTT